MSKRPLCVAAFLLFLICFLSPPGLWCKDLHQSCGDVTFAGKVGRREVKNEIIYLYLHDTDLYGARWIRVRLNNSDSRYLIGNTLLIKGQLKMFDRPSNPGEFDSYRYYQLRKVDAQVNADSAEVLDASYAPVREGLESLRETLGIMLEYYLSEEDAGVMKAMLLGAREEMPEEIKTLYRESGISHILAISGLHVSLLGMGVYRLLRKTGLGFRSAGIPAGLFLIAYGIMSGGSVSSIRALVMFLLAITADMIGRTYDTQTALSCSAIGILLEQPLYARDAAFLLSFGAVLGVTMVTPLVQELPVFRKYTEIAPEEKKKRIVGSCLNGLSASIGITIATLPVMLYFYYSYPLFSPALNLFVLPLMGPLLAAGILCIIMGALSVSLGILPAFFVKVVLRFFYLAATLSLKLPGAKICLGRPRIWEILLYYAALGGVCTLGLGEMTRKRKLRFIYGEHAACVKSVEHAARALPFQKAKRIAAAVWVISLLLVACVRPKPPFSLTMLNVGQGDCLYFHPRGGATYLCDAGSTSRSMVGKYVIAPYLKQLGTDKVDYLFVTHGDTDHMNGVLELLQSGEIKIKKLVLTRISEQQNLIRDLEEAAVKAGTDICYIGEGDLIRDGKMSITCIGPGAAGIDEEAGFEYEKADSNEHSMILSIRFGAFTALLTGDAEGPGETKILTSPYTENSYDILKVAHHGSEYSSGTEILARIRPRSALISCGKKNRYGHPHKALLGRLEDIGADVFRTDEDGAILVSVHGTRVRTETQIEP